MSIADQLQKIIKKKRRLLDLIACDIAEGIQKELRDMLDKRWYSAYEPIDYERSYELLDSITAQVTTDASGGHDIIIGFDMNKIRAREVSRGATTNNGGLIWNRHMSFDKQPFVGGLIEMIEHGFNGRGSRLNPRRLHAGTHVVEETRKWAQKRARQLLKERL